MNSLRLELSQTQTSGVQQNFFICAVQHHYDAAFKYRNNLARGM
jgi:hypothetical protein